MESRNRGTVLVWIIRAECKCCWARGMCCAGAEFSADHFSVRGDRSALLTFSADRSALLAESDALFSVLFRILHRSCHAHAVAVDA